MVLTIEVSTQVVVVLVEEVSLTDTNPEELGVLGEEVVDLRVRDLHSRTDQDC